MTVHTLKPLCRQSGISLVVALVFLVALTLIGLAAMNNNVMQEKMAGNGKDSNLAFQAAEAGLRDAETDISVNINASSAFGQSCTNGLCTPPTTWATPTSTSIWKLVNWGSPSDTRSYGQYTGNPALPDVAAQPLYVIERLSSLPAPPGKSVGLGIKGASNGTAYRVTVYATGARPQTHVVLQSIYVMQ